MGALLDPSPSFLRGAGFPKDLLLFFSRGERILVGSLVRVSQPLPETLLVFVKY